MKTSPTQRSLKLLREAGCSVQVVEKWNPFAKIRQDLFGWIDIVALDGVRIIGVQTTSYPNGKARLAKAKYPARLEAAGKAQRNVAALQQWHEAGGTLMLHEWKKIRGKWDVVVTTLKPEDLE